MARIWSTVAVVGTTIRRREISLHVPAGDVQCTLVRFLPSPVVGTTPRQGGQGRFRPTATRMACRHMGARFSESAWGWSQAGRGIPAPTEEPRSRVILQRVAAADRPGGGLAGRDRRTRDGAPPQ